MIRWFGPVALLLLFAIPASAQIQTLPGGAAQQCSTGTSCTTGDVNVSVGNTVVVTEFRGTDVTCPQAGDTVTDSAGNTYTSSLNCKANGFVGVGQQFITVATHASSTDDITVTYSGSKAGPLVYVTVYSGVNSVSPLDITAGAVASATSSAFTTTQAAEVIVSAAANYDNQFGTAITAGNIGGTLGTVRQTDGQNIGAVEDLVVSTIQTSQTAALTYGVGTTHALNLTLSLKGAILSSITVSPSNGTIATGGTLQFTATGIFAGGGTGNLTSTATWNSTMTGIATVTAGLVTGVSHGTSTITATSGAITSNNATATVTTQDAYGGDGLNNCTGTTNTGFFHLYKDTAVHHWMFCDPIGKRYWMVGMQEVDGGNTAYDNLIASKYSGTGQYVQNVSRLQAFGYNAIGYSAQFPYWPVDTFGGGNANSNKMPFVYYMSPAHDGGQMDVFADAPQKYSDLGGYRGFTFPDVFNANWTTAVQSYATTACCSNDKSPFTGGAAAADASPWLLGTYEDDTDFVESWNGGDTHLGYVVGMMPPYMWFQNVVHNRGQQIYSSPTVQLKANLQTYLTGKYTNVAGLNSAWGSTYTTLGSSATTVTAESIGTGNGSTTTFSHTFAHGVVDAASIIVLVGGVQYSGDSPWFNVDACTTATNTGCVQGNSSSGSVSYASSGPACGGQTAPCITITFAAPPAMSAAVTVTYQYGGWPKAVAGGTGLLDEDGTSAWYPNTITPPDPPTGTTVGTDLNTFLGMISAQYHSVINTWVKTQLPHHMLFSADPMSPFTRAVILANAAPYLDAIMFNSIQTGNNASANAIASYNANGVPIIAYEINAAQPDSPYSATPCPINTLWCFTTQNAKGAAYQADLTSYWNGFKGGDGYGFVAGIDMWQFTDNNSEQGSYGLVTLLDNIYGYPPQCSSSFKEDVTASITDCYNFTTTGQGATYGVFSTGVALGNGVWLNNSTPTSLFGGVSLLGGAAQIH